MTPERPNFYELLELDPAVDDWAKIKERLDEKRRAWSRAKYEGPMKAQRRAADSLARVKEIEAVLSVDESRRQEAAEAVKRHDARRSGRRKELLAELDEKIEILLAAGECSEEQLAQLAAKCVPELSADEVRRRVEARAVRIARTSAAPRHVRKETIDPVSASTIKSELEHLGLKDLYEFLGLDRKASPRALVDRATEIHRENLGKGRTDSMASAQNALTCHCQRIFGSAQETERYDNYLDIQKMESLNGHLELVGKQSGFLGPAAVGALVKQARQRGVSTEDALAYIEDYAAKRKWRLRLDADLPSRNAEDSVAIGNGMALPGIKALLFLEKKIRVKVTNVTSKSLGIVVVNSDRREVVSNVIEVNEEVPRTITMRLSTLEENQTQVDLVLMENRLPQPQVELADCLEIGRAVIEFGRPLTRGSSVEITFEIGADGLLRMSGKDLTTGREVTCGMLVLGALSHSDLRSA